MVAALPKTKPTFDGVGNMLNTVATASGIYPCFVVVFFFYSGFDPIFQFQTYVPLVAQSDTGFFWFALFLVRCLFIIPVLQICHTISLVICSTTISMQMFLSLISSLDKSASTIFISPAFARKIMLDNDVLNIILQHLSVPIGTCAAVLMFAGLVLSTTFNFVSIGMSQIIPMPIYAIFPAVAVIIPGIMKLMMPMIINIYEGGQKVTGEWKYYAQYSKDLKYLTRKLRAARVVRANVGVLGFTFFFAKKIHKDHILWGFAQLYDKCCNVGKSRDIVRKARLIVCDSKLEKVWNLSYLKRNVSSHSVI